MAEYFSLIHKPAPDFSQNGGTWIVALSSDLGNGEPTLSHDCASFREFSRQIDHLKADLDRLSDEAKQHFARIDTERAARSALP